MRCCLPQVSQWVPSQSQTPRVAWNLVRSIAMYNHMARALPRKNPAGTLYKEAADSIQKSHNTSHSLSIAREWHHLNDVGGIAYDLVVRPTKILCKLQQRHLCLASGKHGSTARVIYVLECGRVDRNRCIKQLGCWGVRAESSFNRSIAESFVMGRPASSLPALVGFHQASKQT